MNWLSQILFLIVLAAGTAYFALQIRKVRRAIALGRPEDRKDRPVERLQKMILVAFGQQKMFHRLTPALLHGVIYVSFLVINLEVLEIVIDGLAGTHRILGQYTGIFYDGLMWLNEVLGALVIVASIVLLFRRNVLKIRRFSGIEMQESKGWITRKNYSYLDANVILITEIVLMLSLFVFNIADISLHKVGSGALSPNSLPGVFPISGFLANEAIFGYHDGLLHVLEKIGWWGHITGILIFLNYLPVSKHFHIIMSFPNVYFSKLDSIGKMSSPVNIQEEVKAALDYSYVPPVDENAPKRFGAQDVTDLSWKSLLDAYSCTECGRCTDVCPANMTGKKLSPRKIVMNVRDRLEEIQKYKLVPNEEGILVSGNGIAGAAEAASHKLLSDYYITEEELRACTTCNACVDACPVNIDQVSIITELRRNLVMEASSMPEEWVGMFTNIENNGAPWAFPAADRFKWAENLE